MKTKEITIILIFWFISVISTYAQTEVDYKVYSTFLDEVNRNGYIESNYGIQDGDIFESHYFLLTNSLSNLALSRIDEKYKFEYGIKKNYKKNKFIIDERFFTLDFYAPIDSLTGELQSDRKLENVVFLELLDSLKLHLLDGNNICKEKFETELPIRIIDNRQINKEFPYGVRINKRDNLQNFIEFSTIVYKSNYAMFYYSNCSGCNDIRGGFGGIVIMERKKDHWICLGIAAVYSKYDWSND